MINPEFFTNRSANRANRLNKWLQPNAFKNRCRILGGPLELLLEKLRSNSERKFETLTQSLFERPTLEDEKLIATAFRQPSHFVNACLAKNRIYNSRFEQRRNQLGRVALVRRYCESFHIPQREEYLDLVRLDTRSRIVASFHCGDFLFGSANLLGLDARTRKKYVVSLNRSSSACYLNLAAGLRENTANPDCEILLDETSSSDISQKLRAGNTSILLFCDLPPGLNENV